jgi:hypothetical protein
MSSLCCRSISSRVMSESISVNFLIQDSSLPFGRASGPGPSSYRPTKEAGAMARQGSLLQLPLSRSSDWSVIPVGVVAR